ncbi:MAG: hypothetical protein ACFFD4_30830 [Candidatus Odinarchaeota archaeon]
MKTNSLSSQKAGVSSGSTLVEDRAGQPIQDSLEQESRQLLTNVKRLIASKTEEESGFIEFGYKPRLLESILLASYITTFCGVSAFAVDKMIRKLQIAINEDICPSLDLNLQNLLVELYYMSDSRDIKFWLARYSSLLNEMFTGADKISYYRKIVSFHLLAMFVSPEPEVKNEIKKEIKPILAGLETTTKRVQTVDLWRKVYYYLFILLNEPERDIVPTILKKLLKLQTADGTWQKNNFFTLLVVHTLRYCKFDQEHPEIVSESLKLADDYLLKHECGLSVLDSMKTYNSVLFYALRYLYEGEIPPSNIIETLVEQQAMEGGWCLQPDMISTDIDTTVFALLTLLPSYQEGINNAEFKEKLRNALKNGVQYVLSAIETGNSPMYAGSNEALPEMDARIVMLLAALPKEFISSETRNKLLTTVLQHLNDSQSQDGIFEYFAYSNSNLYGICQAALSLYYLQRSPYVRYTDFQEIIDAIFKKLQEYLSVGQNKNGSYSSRKYIHLSGELHSTCYAIMTHSVINRNENLKCHLKAISWLLQYLKLGISSFSEATGPRPIRYNDLAHGPLFIYFALISSLNAVGTKIDQMSGV